MEPQATHPEDDKRKLQIEARAHALGYATFAIAPIIADLTRYLDHGLHRDVHSIDVGKLNQLVLYAVDRAAGSAEQVFRKARMEGFHQLNCDDPQWRGIEGAPPAYHVIAKIAPVLFRLQLARYESEPELLARDIEDEKKLLDEFGDDDDADDGDDDDADGDDDAGIKGIDEAVQNPDPLLVSTGPITFPEPPAVEKLPKLKKAPAGDAA